MMRVLIATRRTNGDVANDVDYCVAGELLMIGEYCDCCRIDPGSCGCGIAFSGLNSHRMTTTAIVAEVALSEAEVREAIRSSLRAGGWFDADEPELAEQMVAEAWQRIQHVATHFEVGTVLGRRLDVVYEREVPASRP
ncbi:DUF7715 family protein [Pseudactinotalea sp. Z1748]|uniref:DUF7715 family protein n=1 Tax=Pseudactinotalea sp. Z1748 TaxID=3413027 RepID=UPI003C7A6CF8